ncbi:hypothetical protein K438DRAFT_2023232 [Mycena galopus ATCC 62051]|nr:hypothetical protein K438DRAFT_2023232 [Mycena galopus ATCC 62051]
MPSDDQDLCTIRQAEQKRATTLLVFNEMKSSLLSQINWEELLQSAPTAISSMGACFVASSSPKALVMLKAKPGKHFEYLKYSSIQANLVECGNLGRFAFLEAEKGMGTIQLTSQIINRKINDIIQCLGDPASAKRTLKPQLNAVGDATQQCLESAIAMDEKFDKWLKYVSEMHAACVEEENGTEMQLLQNINSLAVTEEQLKRQQSTAEATQATQDLMQKQVELASEAFKKASDSFPSGWNLIAQNIVQDCASAARGALNQMISTCNPAIWVNLLKSKNMADGCNRAGATRKTQRKKSVAVVDLQDPAYSAVQLITQYLTGVAVIINGSSGIDWEKARGDGTKEGAGGNITFFARMLEIQRDSFKPGTNGEASVNLTRILETSARIAREIDAKVQDSFNMTASYPQDKSKIVIEWKRDFAEAHLRAQFLIATAKSIPGTPATDLPIAAHPSASQTAPIDTGSLQAQTTLGASKYRLAMTQEMLMRTHENYTKTTEMLLKQQEKLGEIQADLTRLSKSNVSLEEIKRILVECIKLIVHLKAQIQNLVRFFQAISSTLKVVVRLHVNPFLQTIQMSVATDVTGPDKDLVVGNYTLTDYQRTMLYDATITLRAHFSVFGDIARMWVKLSQENIFPGLKMCDEMSVTTQDRLLMNRKVEQLEEWSRGASECIKQIAHEKQQEILSGMEERIVEVEKTTKMIAPFPPNIVKAISDGAQITSAAVQTSIDLRTSTSFQLDGLPEDD